jgi:hypothetical protein
MQQWKFCCSLYTCNLLTGHDYCCNDSSDGTVQLSMYSMVRSPTYGRQNTIIDKIDLQEIFTSISKGTNLNHVKPPWIMLFDLLLIGHDCNE